MHITTLFPHSPNNASIQQITWRSISDQVMGGVSQGQLQSSNEIVNLQGHVSLENNGGFLQMQTVLPSSLEMQNYQGISLHICSEFTTEIQLLIKSSQLWMPWQSYRATIHVSPEWQEFIIPFTQFQPYKTKTPLNPQRITKFAVLAGGQIMDVNISLKHFGLYQD